MSDVPPEIVLDEREGEIHSGGDTGRRPHLSVPDENGFAVDLDARMCPDELPLAAQWVVTLRPSTSPAAAGRNTLLHTACRSTRAPRRRQHSSTPRTHMVFDAAKSSIRISRRADDSTAV
ncbi:hypothetical protein [Streptomyces sp. NPDC048187]|uniref:hypothetical protein n=1 Tax=Streptomyces sp. NPDC048187 TaxID=3365509 RepID=UPI0037167C1F